MRQKKVKLSLWLPDPGCKGEVKREFDCKFRLSSLPPSQASLREASRSPYGRRGGDRPGFLCILSTRGLGEPRSGEVLGGT